MEKTQRRILAAVVGTTVAMSGAAAVLAGEGGGAAAPREAPAASARSALAGPILQTIDLVPATGSAPTESGFTPPGTSGSAAAVSQAAASAPRSAVAVARAVASAPRSDAAVAQAAHGAARTGSVTRARAVAARTTGRFSLVGATWDDPRRALGAAVEIRTRRAADGAWTPWQRLEADGASPAEPGTGEARVARGSTDPLWVGDSDGVQARVAAGAGRAGPLPDGLRVDLINPTNPANPTNPTHPAPRIVPAAFALPVPARGDAVTLPPRPAPSVVSRAGWGANEAIVKGTPEYSSDVQVVFVHHTAGTNSYSCADSASIVRAIEAYHVRSNHWNDIGYNFLVDKCGTLFEGRRGGITRPVLGAHTLGFNTRSSAIAVLGNYAGRAVPARVKQVIAQVAAYKIGAYGSAPTGRVAMVSSGSDRFAKGSTAMLNRISGHRDTGRTECPGNTLYAQLGSIRGLAGAGPGGLAVTKVNGAAKVGDTYYTRGTLRPFWQVSTPTTMLHRFDVLVDDVLTASAARGAREQLLTLSPGPHMVRIRAVALNGRTAVTTAAVQVDQELPEFTSGPSLSLRTGSLNGIVPLRLRWSVADAGGLGSLDLTTPAPVRLDPAATAWAGSVRVGAETTYGLRATDRAGNARSVAVRATALIAAEGLAERTGTWHELPGTAYLGATALRSTAADSSLTWAFTGSSAALAVSRTAASGRVRVIVDGEPAGVVDLRSPETLHRRAVWTRSWATSARHTVRIEVEGTAGRPGVVVDGLAYLR